MPTTTKPDRLKQAHESLTQAVESIVTGDDWQRLLKVASKFHDYSFNKLLIFLQRPHTTVVADPLISTPRVATWTSGAPERISGWGNPGAIASVYQYMRTLLGAGLVFALFATTGCSGDSEDTPTGPANSAPVQSDKEITDCRGLRVPRQELHTDIDPQEGTITYRYSKGNTNFAVTIQYRDKACRENPETRKLIKNVLSAHKAG